MSRFLAASNIVFLVGLVVILCLGCVLEHPSKVLVVGDSYGVQMPSKLLDGFVDRCAVREATALQVKDLLRQWPVRHYDRVIIVWGIAEHLGRKASCSETEQRLQEIRSYTEQQFPDARISAVSIPDILQVLQDPKNQHDSAHLNLRGWQNLADLSDAL